jgi:hypothetical protein
METKIPYDPKPPVPEGYLRDSAGRLVPAGLVKPADLQRDQLVRDLFAQYEALQYSCKAFREAADAAIDAHLALVAEQYGVKRGGQEGNLALSSYDGELRIMRSVDKQIAFTDEIHAAKRLIFACLADWTASARDELKVIADDAFRTDAQGHLSVGRILGLLRWSIKDPRWLEAMKAIRDSIRVQATRDYLRFYRRDAATKKYDPEILLLERLQIGVVDRRRRFEGHRRRGGIGTQRRRQDFVLVEAQQQRPLVLAGTTPRGRRTRTGERHR